MPAMNQMRDNRSMANLHLSRCCFTSQGSCCAAPSLARSLRWLSPMLVLVAWIVIGAPAVAAGEGEVSDAEPVLRVSLAANPEQDGQVVEAARRGSARGVVSNGGLVAEWVPIRWGVAETIAETGSLVTRPSPDDAGVIELLILAGPDDVTDADVQRTYVGRDARGRPAVNVRLGEDGAERMSRLSGENLGRHLAIIIDDQVHGAPELMARIGDQFQIAGDFTDDEAQSLAQHLRAHAQAPAPPLPPTVWARLVVAGVALLALLAALPTGGVRMPRPSRWVSATGAVVGLILGTWWLGVSVTTGGGTDAGGGGIVIQHDIWVSLPHALVGALLGVVVGLVGIRIARLLVLRAMHNGRRLLARG